MDAFLMTFSSPHCYDSNMNKVWAEAEGCFPYFVGLLLIIPASILTCCAFGNAIPCTKKDV